MQFGLFTIIKDEQKYLDEWIQYHFNLGISRIFMKMFLAHHIKIFVTSTLVYFVYNPFFLCIMKKNKIK